jgi:hypothetical protein
MVAEWKTVSGINHRDGKQQLGLGESQVCNGEGQTRHVYLVSAA